MRREPNARRAVNRVFAFDDEAMALVHPHVDHRGDHRSSVADLHCEHGTYGGPTALAQLVDRSKSLAPSPRRTDSIPRRYSNKSRIAMTASSPGQGDLQTPTGAGPNPLMLDDRFGRRTTKSSTLPEDPHLSTLSSWAVVAASAGASPSRCSETAARGGVTPVGSAHDNQPPSRFSSASAAVSTPRLIAPPTIASTRHCPMTVSVTGASDPHG